MPDPARFDPTNRFTGLANVYARHRPTYPGAALDFIQQQCGLQAGMLLVDVGCGTGISSRLFALRGLKVIGVEPNAEMRGRAAAETLPPGVPPPRYVDGKAEA